MKRTCGEYVSGCYGAEREEGNRGVVVEKRKEGRWMRIYHEECGALVIDPGLESPAQGRWRVLSFEKGRLHLASLRDTNKCHWHMD